MHTPLRHRWHLQTLAMGTVQTKNYDISSNNLNSFDNQHLNEMSPPLPPIQMIFTVIYFVSV